MRFGILSLATLALVALCYVATSINPANVSVAAPKQDGTQQGGEQQPGQEAIAEMMAKAQKYTQPSEKHELLKRFLGDWDVEAQMFSGDQAFPASKGNSTVKWLVEGRWLMLETNSELMGMANQTFTILGYDNFKMSYVFTNVHSMDTAMTHAEGDMDPSGNALIMYGTLDEYLTGEHDKMVKYVWRFVSEDKMTLEVHDLPIGETNTKVLEFRFTRSGE